MTTPASSNAQGPRVFISYSHDSAEHLSRVLELSTRLRADGVDCIIDRYEMSPPRGWAHWTESRIEEADFVLIVCTETYLQRFRAEEGAPRGLGVKWEGAVITQGLYDNEASNVKFIPVLFSPEDAAHIPRMLRGVTRYLVGEAEDYESLYRRLINQPLILKPEVGALRPMPPLEPRQ